MVTEHELEEMPHHCVEFLVLLLDEADEDINGVGQQSFSAPLVLELE